VYTTNKGLSLRFTKHAWKRIHERGIAVESVKDAIDEPDITHPDVKENTCFIKALEDGQRIRVVFDGSSNPATVITVVTVS